MFPATVATLAIDPGKVGTRLGMCFYEVGLAFFDRPTAFPGVDTAR